jgi:hypothetical protein
MRLQQPRLKPLFAVHTYWTVTESRRLLFITDAIPVKGVIKDFLWESTYCRHKVMVRWFRLILEVLRYLHGIFSPIVHSRIHPLSIFVRCRAIKVDLPYLPRIPSQVFLITPFTPLE